MTLGEIISQYWDKGLLFVIVISGIIQFAPIKLNPWSWIAKKIGNIMNGDVVKKIETLEKTLDEHVQKDEENYIESLRVRILRFADEVKEGHNFSQNHFEQVLNDITSYNNYCDTHPGFKNKVTEHSSVLIEEVFDEKLRNNSFL